MSAAAPANWTAQQIQARSQLETLFVPSVLWIVGSVFGIGACSVTLAAVIRSRKLRSVHYNAILHQAAADLFLCGVVLTMASKRVFLYLSGGNEVTRTIDCLGWTMPMTSALNISASQTAAMAFLRLFAMIWPAQFDLLRQKYVHMLNGLFWVAGFAVGGAMGFGNKGAAYVPVCLHGLIYYSWALELGNGVQYFWFTVAGVIIHGLTVALWVRVRASRIWGQEISGSSASLDIRATRTVRLVAIRYFVFSIGPSIFSAVALATNATKVAALIPPYANFCACTGCCVNFFLYLATDSEFRAAAKSMVLQRASISPKVGYASSTL